MQKKWFLVLVISLVIAMFLTSGALAAKLLCVSKQELKGEETVDSCLAKGEEFAIVDDYGIVHILTKREVELTKAFNPEVLKQRAFGLRSYEKAPEIKKVFGSVPLPAK